VDYTYHISSYQVFVYNIIFIKIIFIIIILCKCVYMLRLQLPCRYVERPVTMMASHNNCLANVSGPLYQNNQLTLTLGGQTLNVDLGPSALSIPDVERLIGERLYADQSQNGMWVALAAAAQAIHSNVQLASPYTSNWNSTIDVTDGIDAIPEAAHLAGSTVYVKPVTLFADTVQNRVQAVVLGGLEVTGSLWEKLLGFSSTQIGNNTVRRSGLRVLSPGGRSQAAASQPVCVHVRA
jgi:hypothetical protein